MAQIIQNLSERDEDILRALHTYRYLTVRQVTRLFFAASSKNHAGEYLKRLTNQQYVYRFPLPSTRKGNPEFVYILAYAGVRYLRSLGVESATLLRLRQAPSYFPMQHTLRLNDVLIAAALLERHTTTVQLADMRHEWVLKQTPFHLDQTKPYGKEKGTTIPDAWLDFRIALPHALRRFPIWWEQDMGTVEQKAHKEKIQRILRIVNTSAYEHLFGTPNVTIAFATTTGIKRTQELRSWTQEELAQGKSGDTDLFLFTSLPKGELDPITLFLSPIWLTLFDSTPVPLLETKSEAIAS